MDHRLVISIRIFAILSAMCFVALVLAQEAPKQESPVPGSPPNRPMIDRPQQQPFPLAARGPRTMRREARMPARVGPWAQVRPGRIEGGGIAGLLRLPQVQKELGITDEQRRKLEDIGYNTLRASIQQEAALQVLRLDLDRLKRADSPDRAAIDKKIQEIAQAEAALMRSRVNAELDVREVLTKEQRDKLMERAHDVLMQRRRMPNAHPDEPIPPPPVRERGTPIPKVPPLPGG